MIVDNYFIMMEQLGDKIENLEEEIIHKPSTKSLANVNQLRKEISVLKRSISQVEELIHGFIKTDSDLIHETTNKYFKIFTIM